MNAELRVDAGRLIEFGAAVYASAGVPEADAQLLADTEFNPNRTIRMKWTVCMHISDRGRLPDTEAP